MAMRRYPPRVRNQANTSQPKANTREPNNQTPRSATRSRTNVNNYQSYTTVVDYDAKYDNRQIKSNWGKYQQDTELESNSDADKVSKPKDFNFLLANASSDCSHFEFRCEKEWKKESTLIATNGIFNLDLKVLSNGLACVPFYQRIGLDESELTPDDKAMFDTMAENQAKVYNPIKENFLKQFSLESESTQSCVDDLIKKLTGSTLEELLETKFDLNVEDKSVSEVDDKSVVGIEKNLKSVQILKPSSGEVKETSINIGSEIKNKTTANPSNSVFYDDKENLEEWLDNMLDD